MGGLVGCYYSVKIGLIHNNLLEMQACNNTFHLQHFVIEWNIVGGLVCLQWSGAFGVLTLEY